MAEINKDLLRSKIIRSKELTALEKRYLESMIEQAGTAPPQCPDCIHGIKSNGTLLCERRGACFYAPKEVHHD